MRAAIVRSPFDMTVSQWETPRPAAGEVLVSTRAAGICADDLCIHTGKNPCATYPQIVVGSRASVNCFPEALQLHSTLRFTLDDKRAGISPIPAIHNT